LESEEANCRRQQFTSCYSL